MTPADLLHEILYPLRSLTLLLANVTFAVVLWLVIALLQLGPLALILAILFSFVMIPAMFRYAMTLLEARAHGRDAVVADITVFSMFDSLWTVFPMILLAAMIWIGVTVGARVDPLAAQVLSFLFFLAYPASIAVLGITHSPLESINPAALFRLVRECGVNYVWIPVILTTVSLLIDGLAGAGLPLLPTIMLRTYSFLLLFTLTGAVVHVAGIVTHVEIGAPVARSAAATADALAAERQKVATHAYGFISRGNRDGGLRHIRDWIGDDPDPDDAVSWFFNEMMGWDSKDAALVFGQEGFAHYLHHDNDAMALKVISACLHENPRWKPKPEDRQHAIELAKRYRRDELIRSLCG